MQWLTTFTSIHTVCTHKQLAVTYLVYCVLVGVPLYTMFFIVVYCPLQTAEGFGFNVMGGKEQKCPIYISRIIPGGYADKWATFVYTYTVYHYNYYN